MKLKGGEQKLSAKLQLAIAIITLICMLMAGGAWIVSYLGEPQFEGATHMYDAAHFEYGTTENTLYVEVTPDGKGGIVISTCEALHEVHKRAWINHNIHNKPLRVVVGGVNKTEFTPYVLLLLKPEWYSYPDETCLLDGRGLLHTVNSAYISPSAIPLIGYYKGYKLSLNSSAMAVECLECEEELT